MEKHPTEGKGYQVIYAWMVRPGDFLLTNPDSVIGEYAEITEVIPKGEHGFEFHGFNPYGQPVKLVVERSRKFARSTP